MGKIFKNSPCTLTFCLFQKMTCPDWTIYSWYCINSWGCPLMLTTNYRCVQSPNISLDVAKCGENFHKFTLYTHFLSLLCYKKWLVLTEQSFQVMFLNSWCSLMLTTNYRCVQSPNIFCNSLDCRQMWQMENFLGDKIWQHLATSMMFSQHFGDV